MPLDSPKQWTWTQSILAGAVFNPLEDWEYETPDRDCKVEVLTDATLTGLVASIKSGGDTIFQEAPVKAGGVAGVMPAPLNTTIMSGLARRAQKLRVAYRNPTGGAITTNGVIILTPGGGGGGGRRAPPRRTFGGRRRR